MMEFTLDATIIVAIVGLFGTIYTSKMSTLTKMNEQLMELVEESHEEIRQLKTNIIISANKYTKELDQLIDE